MRLRSGKARLEDLEKFRSIYIAKNEKVCSGENTKGGWTTMDSTISEARNGDEKIQERSVEDPLGTLLPDSLDPYKLREGPTMFLRTSYEQTH